MLMRLENTEGFVTQENFDDQLNIDTIKLDFNDHPWDPIKVAAVDRRLFM
jgi:hypothetical protein